MKKDPPYPGRPPPGSRRTRRRRQARAMPWSATKQKRRSGRNLRPIAGGCSYSHACATHHLHHHRKARCCNYAQRKPTPSPMPGAESCRKSLSTQPCQHSLTSTICASSKTRGTKLSVTTSSASTSNLKYWVPLVQGFS